MPLSKLFITFCKRVLAYLACGNLFLFSVNGQTKQMLHSQISIDINAVPQVYNRMIFGQFIEHFHRQIYGGIFEPGSKLSDSAGFRLDVIAALRDLKVPVVRWPGGCFVSSYHWLDGIGKVRTPSYDKAWQTEDPNTFGTDEYIQWCRLIGAEPYICTNAGTGTPEEMSNWVEYCNLNIGKYGKMRIANGHKEPYNVKYWSVGNENYGGWEMGAKTVDEWGYFVRESCKLMFAVTPNVKLFAAALADDAWTVPLLERAGEHLNYVSIHGYWDWLYQNNNPSDYKTCMLKTTEPEKQIKHCIDILKKTGFDKTIKIAFDEWNLRGWHHPGQGNRVEGQDQRAKDKNDINSTYTMADAIFSACFLNSCLRNADFVTMACMAPVVNARGPLYVYPEGIVKRTTFHVMSLYANHLQPNVLPLSIQCDSLKGKNGSVPVVDGIATCNNNKKILSIALVNKDAMLDATCRLNIKDIDGNIDAILLSGDSADAYNDVDKPDNVVPQKKNISIKNGSLVIPAHSLMIIEIKSK